MALTEQQLKEMESRHSRLDVQPLIDEVRRLQAAQGDAKPAKASTVQPVDKPEPESHTGTSTRHSTAKDKAK
jgi:hypothetical protein